MEETRVQVKKLKPSAVVPERATNGSAGYDLVACIDDGRASIRPGDTLKIGTGVAMSFPSGTFGAVYPRSGISTNRGLRLANCVGVIDSDYTGEIIVALHNDSDDIQNVYTGDKIAQLVLQSYIPFQTDEVFELTKTARGAGGFGSTDSKKN